MSREIHVQMLPQNRERNERIASILTLLITIAHKIENIKQKLCGFSSRDFSPQCVFEALDLTNKGYLDMHDVKQFVGNDRIQDQDILRLFLRLGSSQQDPKLTYLGYLNLLKPHFDNQLGRDLLLRDTVKKSGMTGQRQTQQTVLLLLNELFLLNCVCIAQHEQMKNALIDEYMLNCLELKEILGLGNTPSAIKAIFEFIDYNSNFAVQQSQIRYLLAYLRIPEYELSQEHVLSYLFVPVRLNMQSIYKKGSITRVGIFDKVDKERQKMHLNYDKTYLIKADLSATVQKLSFLNYIHPNSYQHKPPTRNIPPPVRKNVVDNNYRTQRSIADEHVDVYNARQLNNSQVEMKQRPILEASKVEQTIINRSRLNQSQIPVRLIASNVAPIHTPILEQFMHESNIKRNVGDYKPPPQQPKLNVLLEESAYSRMSDSEAFQRIPRNNPSYYQKPESRQKVQQPEKSLLNSKWRPKGVEIFGSKISKAGKSSSYGILDQFLRNDVS